MKVFKIERSITFKIGFLYLILAFINIIFITTLIAINQGDLITENILLNSYKNINEYIEKIDNKQVDKLTFVFEDSRYPWAKFNSSGEIITSSNRFLNPSKTDHINIRKLSLINRNSNKRYLINLNLSELQIDNYIALIKGDESSDVILFSTPIEEVTTSVFYMIKIIIMGIFLSFLVNGITAFVLYKLIIKPLEIISDATKTISKGHYDHLIEVDSNDEFGQVAFGFNQMTQKVKGNIENLNKQMILLTEAKQKIELMASIDELTQILNRRALFERLDASISHAERHKEHLGIIMFDIDHFKAVNDTYGHHAGDIVLKKVSGLLQNVIRKIDILGRYGGEEFVMAFPKTDLESMSIVAEKIRKATEDLVVDTGNEILQVTISLGITEYSFLKKLGKEINPENFINFADTALYVAKESGRNRVEIYNG